MKLKFGSIATDGRGSIAGVTYSRNRGGAYARARVVPINPGSVEQSAVRSALALLTQRWGTTLTEGQRDGWEAYAEAVLLPDNLGDPRNIGGLPMYVRLNAARIQADETALGLIDDAPGVQLGAEFTAPTIEALTPAVNSISFGFDDTDAWANETGGAMFVYVSPPTNVTRNFYKGPYRFAAAILGDDTTAPTSPVAITSPFGFAADQRVHVRVNISRADGRRGTDFRLNGDAS